MKKAKTKARTIEVNNYGEVLALVNQMHLLEYQEKGSYQGSYLAILLDKDSLYFFIDEFGSCSGCDWLEDKDIGDSKDKRYSIDIKTALDYTSNIKPKWIIPKDDKDLVKAVFRLKKKFIKEDYDD